MPVAVPRLAAEGSSAISGCAILAAAFAVDVALLAAVVTPEWQQNEIMSEPPRETTAARSKPEFDFNNYRS